MSLEELAKTAAGVTHNNNGSIGTGSQKKKKRRVLTPLKCKLHLSSKPQVPNGENGNNPVTAESVTSGQFRFPHGMPTSSSLLRLNALREVPPTETSDGPQQTGECPKKGKATRRARSAGDFGLKRLSSSAHPIPQLKAPAFCCTFRRAKTRATLAVSAIPEPLTPEYGASPLKEKNRVTESAVSPSLDNAMGQKLQEELLKPNTFPSRLRKLSTAFFNSQNGDKIDLMNDWEIGGTQNAWVCPSDRHLQLRAQLKSGWSVRTATARSPTNAKQITGGGITDAEREQIQAVLARAEAGKQQETQRIARMVDRLEKMRSRATGNGVTQCLLCQTEFGLLASKSYAAMCLDCRKYVCQKNCGVETFDQKRGEMIFLCKICSEYREVMWKKSGAWFYREVPQVLKNAESPSTSMGNGTPIGMNGNSSPRQMNYSTWQHHGDTKPMPKPPVISAQPNAMAAMSLKDAGSSTGGTPRPSRQLPIPPDQQQRLKTTPRPRITPSWVHEKVQSSMSIGSEDEESSSSAESEYKSGAAGGSSSAIPSSRRHHYNRPRDLSHRHGGSAPGSARTGRRDNASLQRYVLGTRSRITDTEESENDESRRTTPSTSPRHSLATPSSYGGDDVSQNHTSLAAANNEASDAKSIDSGVVQSDDHSVHQRQLRETAQSAPPSSLSSYAVSPVRHTSGAGQPPQFVQVQGCKPTANDLARTTPSPVPPPIPPRTGAGSFGSPLQFAEQRRPSTASSSTASSSVPSRNVQMSHESLHSNFKSRPSSTHSSEFLGPHGEAHCSSMNSDSLSRNSTQSTAPVADLVAKEEETIGSPTFMSSPEDETSTLGSVQFNLTYLPEEKQLIIHLIRAKNLKAMDKNGLSDPYVKFHLIPGNTKATKITSKTIEKTLNPEWHEEMIYYGITEEERLRKTLRLTVLDRDRIGSDFLGETRVALKKLPLGVTKKFNLYLEHAMPAPVEKAEEAERGKILLAVCYNIQQGSLFVHIKRCAELMGMDSSGFSDPYCKVSLTPLSSKAHRQKTAIKKRTLNPEFNETLQFIVPFKDLPKKTLEIGVYDHDVGRHDDYIGGILLSTAAKADRGKQWTQCIENPGKTFEYWHRLESE